MVKKKLCVVFLKENHLFFKDIDKNGFIDQAEVDIMAKVCSSLDFEDDFYVLLRSTFFECWVVMVMNLNLLNY